MKAIFTGRDWSEGYRTGHEYILDFNQETGGNIWIYPLEDKTQSPGKLPNCCEYSSRKTFNWNWTEITIPMERERKLKRVLK